MGAEAWRRSMAAIVDGGKGRRMDGFGFGSGPWSGVMWGVFDIREGPDWFGLCAGRMLSFSVQGD